MLEARSLTCVRDGRRLFSDLSFAVSAGDIVQIEGPNGAGKTSLLRILAGLHYSESGDVRWQQHDIRQQRTAFHAELLFIGHLAGIKTLLTPLENLSFFHPGQDEEALWRALDAVGLPGYEEVPLVQLSAGQQRRVALARLWLSRACLWILDEPLTAIDRAGVAQLMTQFIRHAEQGGMVVLTTHQPLPDEDYPVRKICLHNGEET